MKKILLLSSFLMFSSIAFSQITYNVKAGFNVSTFTGSDADKTQMNTGFKIGAGVGFPINNVFSIQPSLFFSNKGATEKYNNISENIKIECDAYYIELPIVLAANLEINEKLDFVVNGGVYAAYGVGGKTTVTERGASTEDISISTKYDTFGKKGYMKYFDFGLDTFVGLEWQKFIGGIGCQWGLTDATRNDSNAKNLVLSAKIGYKF